MRKILFYATLVWLGACRPAEEKAATTTESKVSEPVGPVTTAVDSGGLAKFIYVSANAADGGDGTKEKPFRTISQALEQQAGHKKTVIFVAAGLYEENGLMLSTGTHLYGGYNEGFTGRDIEQYATTIDAMRKGRIFTLGGNTRVDGFLLRNGTVRGMGGAVFTTAKNVVVSNNIFDRNKTLKPVPWNPEFWHATANDGGAVYCADSAVLTVVNNLFFRNATENGRGGAIAADNGCSLVIENNVFFQNAVGLEDEMRSSDGGAVSIFRWSKATVVNNWFLNNVALHKNDGGGLWIALWSSATVKDNIFTGNVADDDAGAIFVGGQEHRYDAPLDPIPPKDRFFISITGNTIIGNTNSSYNSGAMRFTMEGRGEFAENIMAFNNGIYFQRSEVLIEKNIIFDNFLLVETKEGLKQCVVKNNVIWADYTQGADITPEVTGNNMLYPVAGKGNYSEPPHIVDDGMTIDIASVNFDRNDLTRFILLRDSFNEGKLQGRVVNIGGKWSVIRHNKGRVIDVWGNFAGATTIKIIPTYTLK